MKTQKLIVIAAIVCLLVGASSAAMARNDCPGGSIAGGTFDEIVITDFVDCSVVGVHVTGRVLVDTAGNFSMIGSLVENGDVRVKNSVSAILVDNQVKNGRIVARGNTESFVIRNVVFGDSIRVVDDVSGGEFEEQQVATVLQNLVFGGNLSVLGNEKADVKENKVRDGNIICRANDRLDSKDNNAFGGKVRCSKSFLD
jgi:hypothetical protein